MLDYREEVEERVYRMEQEALEFGEHQQLLFQQETGI